MVCKCVPYQMCKNKAARKTSWFIGVWDNKHGDHIKPVLVRGALGKRNTINNCKMFGKSQ